MTSVDIILALVLAGGFLLGFFGGVIRGVLLLGAWLVAFVVGANLREPLGNYLSTQWTNFTPDFARMLGFAIGAAAIFAVLLLLIIVGSRGPKGFTSLALLDDVIGGLLGLLLAVLLIGATQVVLGTFYEGSAVAGSGGQLGIASSLYAALTGSGIGSAIEGSVMPLLGTLLSPLLPEIVRAAMA